MPDGLERGPLRERPRDGEIERRRFVKDEFIQLGKEPQRAQHPLHVGARFEPRLDLARFGPVVAVEAQRARFVRGGKLLQVHDAIAKARRHVERLEHIILAPDALTPQRCFDKNFLRRTEVAGKSDCQHRRRRFVFQRLQLRDDPRDLLDRLRLLFVRLARKILRIDEPSARRDVDAEDLGLRVREIDLPRREKEPRIEPPDLDARAARIGRIDGQREIRVPQIKRLDEGLSPENIGVIHAQDHLVDLRHRALPIAHIEHLHPLRHQPAARIERELAQVNLHAALVKFLHDHVAPFFREAARIRIPARREQADGDEGK